MLRLFLLVAMFSMSVFLPACASRSKVGSELKRSGDEIMVAGRLFHTGAPVVLWTDPGGYDAYRVERRFSPLEQSDWEHSKDKLESPNRYNLRRVALFDDQWDIVRGGGWPLSLLQVHVDQFVLHYDAAGASRNCFRVLHDERGLSVHFMLDVDGTIYQTLDVKERAWHATKSNDRSVGVEIAQIGAYSESKRAALDQWYVQETAGRTRKTRIVFPKWMGDGGVRTNNFVGHAAKPEVITGTVNGTQLLQYDFTKEQYESLAKLTATLSRVLPKIKLDVPRDEEGNVLTRVLTDEEWERFSGVLGHCHVQANKIDPGPAFDYEKLLRDARRYKGESTRKRRVVSGGRKR